MSSTPSPTPSVTPNGGLNSAHSRRPPRKSTLTQQQKNQKRQRATQDQLSLLEVEFNKNPTPTAAVRERIAQEINMTERSVQIWFQNRRAKIKLLAKKSIESGEDCDAIPDSYRSYLALQALESGKPIARQFLAQAGGQMAYGGAPLGLAADSQLPQKVVIHHFTCRSLSIGTWRRVGQNTMDLVIFYSEGEKPCLTYYINNESAGYKIEFPFAYIKHISLETGRADEAGARPAGLLVELFRPPNFFMDSSGSGGFYQCGDFTEQQQASQIMLHHLGGDPKVLSGQLAKLTLLDSFQQRLNPFADSAALAASAPVSPLFHRPASQPNAMSHPQLALFHETGFGMSLHPHARGHKRTRSRSVPALTDMSFLSQPMPSFHIQHPSTTIADPSIFAPIPQHHHNSLAPTAANNLRIDTAASYGLDFRQYPMSAATTASPSDYASPSFFATGGQMDSMPAAATSAGNAYASSYGLPFLSPMAEAQQHGIAPSVSPLSAMSHHGGHGGGDPVIADQSPPLHNMQRSASADFISMSHSHHANMCDDGLMLSEMYSKQSLSLPIRSPGMEHEEGAASNASSDHRSFHHDDNNADEMDMHNILHFGTLDPSSLSPDGLL